MELTVGHISFGAAAIAYLGLAGFYLLHGRWGGHGPYLLAAALLTAAWALLSLLGHGVIPRYPGSTLLLQQLAMLAWAWLLWHIIASLEQHRVHFPGRLRLGWLLMIGLTVATLGLQGLQVVFGDRLAGLDILSLGTLGLSTLGSPLLPLALGLVIALLGLSLTETLYRGYQPVERWGIKFLCLATGALFAYDVFLYGEGLLFRVLDPAFLEVRGLAQALVVPLFVINIQRSEARHFALGLSQRLVFGSTVVLGAGGYLMIMAVAAFYVRSVGGAWGSAVQVVFLFAGVLLLAAFLLSGSFRAQLRSFLSHHVLSDRYDYRAEWLRFTGRLSETPGGGVEGAVEDGAQDSTRALPWDSESVERRVIRALADIVDSPAGALWGVAESHFPILAGWNLSPASLEELEVAAVAAILEADDQVRALDQAAASVPADLKSPLDGGADQAAAAAWSRLVAALRRVPEAWVLIPLLHRGRLVALLLLTRPRARRELGPEDGELLRIASHQAASHLAERHLARDLAEARQFERFNQRYAFVAHDLKNLVSQLSLVVRNHARFGDRPEFQEDMIATIQSAVERMEHVMARLSGEKGPEGEAEGAAGGETRARVALAPLLQRLADRHQGAVARLELLHEEAGRCRIAADPARIETVLGHLLQNALEAAGPRGEVTTSLRCQGGQAVIEVRDNGPGMTAQFIEETLFKPFRSTKAGGFGIGAYQCRAIAREMGGELEAVSTPGAGTTMRMTLPLEA